MEHPHMQYCQGKTRGKLQNGVLGTNGRSKTKNKN